MYSTRNQTLNKKLVLLTTLLLISGISFSAVQTNTHSDNDVEGIKKEGDYEIKIRPLEEKRYITDFEMVSLDKYQLRREKEELKEKFGKTDQNFKQKTEKINTYLQNRNAPLAIYSEYIVLLANKYDLDYRLVPAISIIESGGGENLYRPYNAWGWGGAKGHTFDSWEESIYTVTRGIAEGYNQRGAATPEEIAPNYNPHTPDEWGSKVQLVMNQMGPEL